MQDHPYKAMISATKIDVPIGLVSFFVSESIGSTNPVLAMVSLENAKKLRDQLNKIIDS